MHLLLRPHEDNEDCYDDQSEATGRNYMARVNELSNDSGPELDTAKLRPSLGMWCPDIAARVPGGRWGCGVFSLRSRGGVTPRAWG